MVELLLTWAGFGFAAVVCVIVLAGFFMWVDQKGWMS